MRIDLKNGPAHVFGRHISCQAYYCKYNEPDCESVDEDLVDKIKKEATSVWALIVAATEAVMAKAGRLTNLTTNPAENLMSIINKFNCGKRINLCKGGSYERRVHVAGLQQTSGYRWHRDAWKKAMILTDSPGKHFKTFIQRREKCSLKQKTCARRRLFPKKPAAPDKHYGPEATDPIDEIDTETLKKLYQEKLKDFKTSAEEIKEIESATIGQHDNDMYTIHRQDRLTASQFGMLQLELFGGDDSDSFICQSYLDKGVTFKVCKRRQTTPCDGHVKQILYKSNFSSAGVIESEAAIVEIKCFPSLARSALNIETAAKEKPGFPVCYSDGTLKMNRKHNYFYQVQGQMRVTKTTKCYFVCYISPAHPITVVEVQRDDDFIKDMLPKLKTFYENCVLPEIVLRRIPKKGKCLQIEAH